MNVYVPMFQRFERLGSVWEQLKRDEQVLCRCRRGQPNDFFKGGEGAPWSCGRTTHDPKADGWLTTVKTGTRQWRCPQCSYNKEQQLGAVTGERWSRCGNIRSTFIDSIEASRCFRFFFFWIAVCGRCMTICFVDLKVCHGYSNQCVFWHEVHSRWLKSWRLSGKMKKNLYLLLEVLFRSFFRSSVLLEVVAMWCYSNERRLMLSHP